MHKKRSFEDYFIDAFSYLYVTVFAVSTLLPFANVFSKAFSGEWAVISGKVGIWPVDFNWGNLGYVVTSGQFINSFKVSVFITAAGTVLAMLMTCIAAYPLSKRGVPGIKQILVLYVFTMLFNGGLIPNYLLIKNLGLLNHLGALVLPGMISVFNLLVVKNYFESLPESLEESAKLDGASNRVILFRIVLPLSLPVLATVALFYAVGYWNEFFNAMMYINKPVLKPLQLYLRDIIMEATNPMDATSRGADELMNISAEGVRAATIVASTVPIMLVYPFLQKYFIKGILIGSVKG